MQYAINLGDLAGAHDPALNLILAPVIESKDGLGVVEAEPGEIGGMAVRFRCEEERLSALVAVIRRKYEKNQLRIYQSKTGNGNWKRV